MSYLIRKVQKGDESILAYIQTESWKSAFKEILSHSILQKMTEIDSAIAMYQQLLDENIGNGYILEINGTPHCMAWWDKAREDAMSDYAELICIHSLQKNWRKGYGAKMLTKVLEDIKNVGYTKVMLWVFTENIQARTFYESLGFINSGKLKPYLNTQEICYEKYL